MKKILLAICIFLGLNGYGQKLDVSLQEIGSPSWAFIYDLSYGYDSTLWAVSSHGGVFFLQNNKWEKLTSFNFGSIELRGILAHSKSDIWVTSDEDGVFHFNGTAWKNYKTIDGLPKNTGWRNVIKDNQNNVWISNYDDAGVVKFNGTTWTKYNKSNSKLKSNYITDMIITKNNEIWIAADNELVSIYNNAWVNFDMDDYLGFLSNVQSMTEDSKGNIWFATDNGLALIDNVGFVDKRDISGNKKIQSITFDNNGAIWYSELFKGLHRYSNGKNTFFDETENSAVPTQCWKLLTNSKNEKIGIGNRGANLIVIDDSEFTVSTNEEFSALKIFPNPANSHININSEKNINEVVIIDLLGRKVFSNKYNESYINLQLAETLTDNCYILEVKFADGELINKKLFIKN